MRRYPNYINLYNGFKLGYEQDVEVHETQRCNNITMWNHVGTKY